MMTTSEPAREQVEARREADEFGVEGSVEAMLLGCSATMGPREVSAGAHVTEHAAARLWHALGFPVVQDDELMFTQADLDALVRVNRLVGDHDIDENLMLATTRAFARTADRLAVWQTQLIAEALTPDDRSAGPGEKDARSVPERDIAVATARHLGLLADDLEPLLVYVWRRHLTAAITRMLADAQDRRGDAASAWRAVGFADLVSFTSLVRRMTERQLAGLVQRFEELASDVVTSHGGRIVKTVGDEVLFVHAEADAGAAIAVDLVDAMREDAVLPGVRVAMAAGPVVSRLGDVFGLTVNRASRLTAVTPRGKVYIDDELARALGSLSGFVMTAQRTRYLRGIGEITTYELTRSSGARKVRGRNHHAERGIPQ